VGKKMKNNIRVSRESQNISQKELADYLGVSQQSVSLYEVNAREPKLETWQKMSTLLNVSIPYLQGIERDTKTINAYIDTYWDMYGQMDDEVTDEIDGLFRINDIKTKYFMQLTDFENENTEEYRGAKKEFSNALRPYIKNIINKTDVDIDDLQYWDSKKYIKDALRNGLVSEIEEHLPKPKEVVPEDIVKLNNSISDNNWKRSYDIRNYFEYEPYMNDLEGSKETIKNKIKSNISNQKRLLDQLEKEIDKY
jgi:DNA-binding XRE family transcriptional regulator